MESLEKVSGNAGKAETALKKSKKVLKKNKSTLILGTVAVIALIVIGLLIGCIINLNKQIDDQDDPDNPDDTIVVDPDTTVTAATLREVIAPAAELTAYKYFYTDVDTYEKSKKVWKVKVPFTTDKSVFSYSGEIGAGIDLDDADFAVDGDTITVTLPKAGILYHELDEDGFRSYDLKNSIFTSVDIGGYSEMIAALKERQEQKLEGNAEFWKNVKANTEAVLRSILTASGQLDEYTINFSWLA